MFPNSLEAAGNTTEALLRSPFAFTMGPFTIYPLFLLPLIFWISPISSTSTATAKSDVKEHKLHQVYTQTSSNPESEDGHDEQLPFYSNQPLNLQSHPSPPSQQKDRFFVPSPLSYYPSLYSYQNQMFNNYPSQSPYSSLPTYPYANINPYIQASPYPPPQNYQSHLYDPYVMMMHMAQAQQPPKYQTQSYQSGLLPQSPQLSNMLSQPPQHVYQSTHSNNNPFFSSHHQQQAKPHGGLQDAQQLIHSMQTDPQSAMSTMSPESGHMLYMSSSAGEPTSMQSTLSHGQGTHNPYQTSAASSSVFSSLSPDTQQLLSSLSPPFGYIDKQTKDTDSILDIIRTAPPKAIMTTASEAILGLRGGAPKHSPFTYKPDKHKQTMHKNKGQPSFKRKPPVVQFNRYSNNKKFNFGNRVIPAVQDYVKKVGKGVKSANATAVPVPEIHQQDKECENCEDEEEEEAPPKYISEPIIPGSEISTPSWEMIEAVMAKTKKDAKPEQAHNILPQDTEDRDDSPPQTELQGDEPIPLFVIGDEDEDSRFFTTQTGKEQEDSSFNSFKHQIYRCPSSRDLRELSEAEIYADPLKCNQFYYCKWGRAYVFKCPVNHVFNPFSNICERDEDFACAMSLKK